MLNGLSIATVGVAAMLLTGATQAAIVTYDGKASFLADAAASSATGALPNLGLLPNGGAASLTVGSVTFTTGPDTSQLWFGALNGPPVILNADWTTLLSGADIAIGGPENLNVALAAPVFSLGFDFVEPSSINVLGNGFVESSFTVTLYLGTTVVDTFTYSRPNNVAAFVGVWSDVAFDRATIREVIPAGRLPADMAENEFFGQFYTGTRALPAGGDLPEPGTALLVGWALAALALGGRRAPAGQRRG